MKARRYLGILTFCCLFFLFAADSASVRAEEAEEIAAPVFSIEAGFYDTAQALTLTAPEGCRVYYTTDGSVPVPGSSSTRLYQNPLRLTDARGGSSVTKGTVVRAVSVTPDNVSSTVITKTYFVGSKMTSRYYIPVISLVTDPDNLYNKETGIFVHYEERGDDWERPMHFEYFSESGEQVVAIDCGARVHGGASRSADTKSLRLYARKEYGEQKKFVYDFFSNGLVTALDINDEPITEFKRLLLRGGGNEATAWERTYFRDTLSAWLMQDTGLDIQASTPCIVFLNGSYYGILNLRERQDERYIEEHYGLKSEEIAIYEFWYDSEGALHVNADADTQEAADQARQEYEEAYNFAITADLTIPENYEKVCEFFDIENYIDYLCIEIYCNNTDWPGNNCKAWRYLGEDTGVPGSDGKVRFLLYDTEFGYGLYGKYASHNAMENALAEDSTEWPNQKGATALFRSLLKNESFRTAFLTRMCDLINEAYEPEAACRIVDSMAARYAGFIKENKSAGNHYDDYSKNVEIVKDFLRERPDAMYRHMMETLDTGEPFTLYVLFDAAMGEVAINSLHITGESNSYDTAEGSFIGIYFTDCSLQLEAFAKEGYRFAGFTGETTGTESRVFLQNESGKPIFVVEAQFEALPATPTPVPTVTPTEAPAEAPDNSIKTGTADTSLAKSPTDQTVNASGDSSDKSKQKYLTFGFVLLVAAGGIGLLLYAGRKR